MTVVLPLEQQCLKPTDFDVSRYGTPQRTRPNPGVSSAGIQQSLQRHDQNPHRLTRCRLRTAGHVALSESLAIEVAERRKVLLLELAERKIGELHQFAVPHDRAQRLRRWVPNPASTSPTVARSGDFSTGPPC